MKKAILTTLSLLLIASLSAQNPAQTKLLKFKGLKGDLGVSWDKYSDMSLDWMKLRTSQDGAFSADLSNMSESSVFYSSIGGNIGGQLLFTAPRLGSTLLVPEVRIGASMTMGKEAIVDFSNNNIPNNEISSLMYCFVENELKLNTEVVWRYKDQSKITFYGGFGVNASGSFDNDLFVFENFYNSRNITGSNNFESLNTANSVDNVYKGKSVFYQRLYIPIGVDLKIFRHLQGTIEYKIGGGLEEVVGGSVSTFRTGEFNFGMRFNIAKNNVPSILD